MSDMPPEQIKAAVDAVLAAARLPVDDDEYQRLLDGYPFLLAQLAELRLAAVRSAQPDLIFRPRPAV